MPTENINKILTYIRLSPYRFNVILFGGEALLHKDIGHIIDVCNNSDDVNKVIILSNGLLDSSQYRYDALYGLTPHVLNEEQEDKFIESCLLIKRIEAKNLKVNIPLNVFNNNIERIYNKLKDASLLESVKFSVIYDDNTKNITAIDEIKEKFSYIDFTHDDGYTLNGVNMNYIDYLQRHLEINPSKDVEECWMNELNIDIDGNISNDCLGFTVNLFNSPLFFKKYRLGNKCTLPSCKDCTGTITSSKIFKESYD